MRNKKAGYKQSNIKERPPEEKGVRGRWKRVQGDKYKVTEEDTQ